MEGKEASTTENETPSESAQNLISLHGFSTNNVSKKDEQELLWEDHPLFMTSMPSPGKFRENPMLAALAAVIDEEEQLPFKPQRRRRKAQVKRDSIYSPTRGSQSLSIGLHKSTTSDEQKHISVANQDVNSAPDISQQAGEPPYAGVSTSLGELQICMRMWKMGG